MKLVRQKRRETNTAVSLCAVENQYVETVSDKLIRVGKRYIIYRCGMPKDCGDVFFHDCFCMFCAPGVN